MIWLLITFVLLAVLFAKIGTISAWLHIATTAFNILLVLLIGLAAIFFGGKFIKKN